MEERQEMDRFGMENDYEGGQWIDGEFYYSKRKEKRHQSKEDALFGVFAASGSSDSDYEGSSRKRRRDNKISRKFDPTKPVHFVSTSTVLPDKEIDPNPEHVTETPGLGSGLPRRHKHRDEDEDEDEDPEGEFLPTEFGRRIKEGAERRRKSRDAMKKTQVTTGGKEKEDLLGGFERHTKGIGAKLLEKMGYRGGGLGKNAQGILAPIEAKIRPKNMGMGFNDFIEKRPSSPLEDPEEMKPKENPKKLWSKQSRGNSKYVTAEEFLMKKQERGPSDLVVHKVLDMRGPRVRVLSNLENLNAESEAAEPEMPVPELQYNARLALDLAGLEVEEADRNLRNARETVAELQRERERLQRDTALKKKQLQAMEEIDALLDDMADDRSKGTLNLETLCRNFGDIRIRFPEDYEIHELSTVACSFALPLLARLFRGWNPLKNPTHGLELVSALKRTVAENGGAAEDHPYGRLLSEVFLPAVTVSGTDGWEARVPEPMLRFVETWDRLLPPAITNAVLDAVIMPKLFRAVDSWNPVRETKSIHLWVHPWLPILGARLEPVYHTIRSKLAVVLQAWHPTDSSALTILSPWKNVFDPASWERFLARHIAPKLASVLREFTIDPSNQAVEPFNLVMTWSPVLPVRVMVKLLEDNFFVRWREVLYRWLCGNPNFEEVTGWYLGWKGLLPQELVGNEYVRYQLNIGLDMMNRAVEGVEVVPPGSREDSRFVAAEEPRSEVGGETMTLKEVIEAYAVQNGLLFRPKASRMHNGHQVYGFGHVSIIVDSLNQKVFAQTEDHWSLISLQQLIAMHHSHSRRRP